MTNPEIRSKLTEWITSPNFVSSRKIYRTIQPDEKWQPWILEFIEVYRLKLMDDYYPMDGDYFLHSTFAFMLATSGGSKTASRFQCMGVEMTAEALTAKFPDKSPLEIIQHGIAVQSGEEFLKRELDPEK